MTPKISIIIPIYKVEDYLPRCIDSVLSQSFTDFELLLIDDGSPDNCGKICDEYAEKDSRVRVFHKPNGGVSSARNLGLDNATGEWIAFIDPDDYVDKEYLNELFLSMKVYDSDFVATIEYEVDDVDKITYLYKKDFNLLFTRYKFDYGPGPVGKLFKSTIISQQNLRFKLNVHRGEDSIFVYSYLFGIEDVVLIISDKYFYDRLRPNSLSKSIKSYESALIGKQEFDKVFVLLKENKFLDEEGIANMTKAQIAHTDIILMSIFKIRNREKRLQKMREIDLSSYAKHKIPGTWKEAILVFLLRNRSFFLYDVLHSVRLMLRG